MSCKFIGMELFSFFVPVRKSGPKFEHLPCEGIETLLNVAMYSADARCQKKKKKKKKKKKNRNPDPINICAIKFSKVSAMKASAASPLL